MALCLYRCYIRWWHHHPMIYRTGVGIASHSPWVRVGLACMSPPSVSPNYRQIHCLLVWGVNFRYDSSPHCLPLRVEHCLCGRLHDHIPNNSVALWVSLLRFCADLQWTPGNQHNFITMLLQVLRWKLEIVLVLYHRYFHIKRWVGWETPH